MFLNNRRLVKMQSLGDMPNDTAYKLGHVKLGIMPKESIFNAVLVWHIDQCSMFMDLGDITPHFLFSRMVYKSGARERVCTVLTFLCMHMHICVLYMCICSVLIKYKVIVWCSLMARDQLMESRRDRLLPGSSEGLLVASEHGLPETSSASSATPAISQEAVVELAKQVSSCRIG